MPGFTTHYLAGELILKCLSKNSIIKNGISNHMGAYAMGLQGPDIFYSYIPELIKKPTISLGFKMHTQNVSLFFQNYLYLLLEATPSGYVFESQLAYLCGLLGHYSIDTLCHPLIYDKIKNSDKKLTPNALSAKHRCLETLLNELILQNENILNDKNIIPHEIINISKKETEYISDIMHITLLKTFGNSSKKYYYNTTKRSLKCTIAGTKLLLSDRYGIKKNFFRYIEKKFIGYPFISSLIPSKSRTATYNQLYQEFIPLFYKGVELGSSILLLLEEYIKTPNSNIIGKKISQSNLIKTIGDNSYHTGLPVTN